LLFAISFLELNYCCHPRSVRRPDTCEKNSLVTSFRDLHWTVLYSGVATASGHMTACKTSHRYGPRHARYCLIDQCLCLRDKIARIYHNSPWWLEGTHCLESISLFQILASTCSSSNSIDAIILISKQDFCSHLGLGLDRQRVHVHASVWPTPPRHA
jgi:hypothetical protein